MKHNDTIQKDVVEKIEARVLSWWKKTPEQLFENIALAALTGIYRLAGRSGNVQEEIYIYLCVAVYTLLLKLSVRSIAGC